MAAAPKLKKIFSLSQKRQILREHYEDGLSISALSRKHQINAVTLYSWKKVFMSSDKVKSKADEQAEELERLRKENEALKKVVADLAVDKAILKEAVEILKKKTPTPAWLKPPKK